MGLDALRILEVETAAHVAELKAEWPAKYNRSYSAPNLKLMTLEEALDTVSVICAELAASDAAKAVLREVYD